MAKEKKEKVTLSPDELADAIRSCSTYGPCKESCPYFGQNPTCLRTMMRDAADCIKSLIIRKV